MDVQLFPLFAMVNHAAMHIHMKVFVRTDVLVSLGETSLEVQLLGHVKRLRVTS